MGWDASSASCAQGVNQAATCLSREKSNIVSARVTELHARILQPPERRHSCGLAPSSSIPALRGVRQLRGAGGTRCRGAAAAADLRGPRA